MDYSTLELSESTVQNLADEYYGITGAVTRLAGEVDFNFYLKTPDHKEYTIKISRPNTDSRAIEFQNEVINFLLANQFPLQVPRVVRTKSKEFFQVLQGNRVLRCQQWVRGRVIDEVNPRSAILFESWGNICGLLSLHLSGFDHPYAHREYKWNPSLCLNQKVNRHFISDAEQLELVDYFWELFETKALPQLGSLRKSVNYNDAHELNLLSDSEPNSVRITGLIDFGDAIYTETINELAIACAYAGMRMYDPLEAAMQVIRGYHQNFELEEKELAVLFPLIAARLLITVVNAAKNKQVEPENQYLLISEAPAWDLLTKMRAISPALAHYYFREVCGFEPCPTKIIFDKWIVGMKDEFASIVDFQNQRMAGLDLSVGSLDLGSNANFKNIHSFRKTISGLLENKSADIGLGGYGEIRPFYSSDAFSIEGNNGSNWRTLHLAMDVWSDRELAVYAPLDGMVFGMKNNEGACNYGPTIILQHKVSDQFIFYTLYGHLSTDSLKEVFIGMQVEKGQRIATVGMPPENGNWPPHLHFQIVLDLLGNEGDFPGVALPERSATWLSLSPDPAPFFPKIEEKPPKMWTPSEIVLARKKYLGKSLSISYIEPLHIVRGYMQYLYDSSARRYLDTVNNVPHVGHQHPGVVEAAQRQIELLNTNTRYLHENLILYAEELLATLPKELSVVYFVNSGSEANELALRMVRAYTGQKEMVAVEVGYHGNTGGCISVSSYKFDGKGGKGAPPQTQVVPIPDTYRGLYRDTGKGGILFAKHVGKAVENIEKQGHRVGGFICESILSCGGQIVLPDGYLKEAYQYVHAAGGLCIADEVQVGLGRVGESFWGFELQQ
ncbi:MAG: aminotransferase class III-fold pyridoxal phosphate-dependent enzyme, partial [Saprospiraceae bacterium]|nr:aminotransferase class III-fold pyridoxal phosphate-dependent enzyme [Saprospiraceae bacterium]